MKHSVNVTIILVVMFVLAQYVGLAITQAYTQERVVEKEGRAVVVREWRELPYEIERPDLEPSTSYLPILAMILVATVLILVLLKLKAHFLWAVWFFLSVWVCLAIALFPFLGGVWANLLGIAGALIKTLRRSVFVHNLTEVFLYGGLAAVFVPLLSLWSVSVLMVVLSVYDYVSVYKTKHMVAMAKAQARMKLFAGFMIPYEKGKLAVLGGGDVAFPLLFAAVALNRFSSLAWVIPLCASGALVYLLVKGEKNKFYPALPYLSGACFIGLGLVWLVKVLSVGA